MGALDMAITLFEERREIAIAFQKLYAAAEVALPRMTFGDFPGLYTPHIRIPRQSFEYGGGYLRKGKQLNGNVSEK